MSHVTPSPKEVNAPSSVLDDYFRIVGAFPHYEPREAQQQMVCRIAESFDKGQSSIIEAGTGSGKSFGYLIPALLQSKRPIVISTATIALQEQLLHKDIPFVLKAAGLEYLRIKLVKGRRNYICIQKLQELERELSKQSSARLYVNYFKQAFRDGWNGDVAELDWSIPPEIWADVQSESEDCLGRKCGFIEHNPYRLAREDMEDADILIANHALYFQDVASAQSLLPPHEVVIFDEAHQLKSYATAALTARVGKFATTKLLRKINRRLMPVPQDFHFQIAQSEAGILEWLFRMNRPSFRLFPDDDFLRLVHQQIDVLTELQQWVASLNIRQLPIVENPQDEDRALVQRAKLITQLDSLLSRWVYFAHDPFDPSESGREIDLAMRERVNWVELDTERLYFELKSTPLNIANVLGETLWPDKTAVFTSATLSVNRSLSFFRDQLGLDNTLDSVLPSPFDYASQCALYLPETLPDPNDLHYMPAVVDEIEQLLRLSQGRAFALFTSVKAMRQVSEALIPRLPYPCKMQGDLPRNRLIQWFKETPNSVLFATATFWEGIDIPGDALSCVIIDRIPFTAPDDPVHQATVEYLKTKGQDWFKDYALPQAIIRLKQGFGRLIRHRNDMGIVAILDPRMRTKGYGQTIRRSLPAVPVLSRIDELKPFISQPDESSAASAS